jgi:hypothetical protein
MANTRQAGMEAVEAGLTDDQLEMFRRRPAAEATGEYAQYAKLVAKATSKPAGRRSR